MSTCIHCGGTGTIHPHGGPPQDCELCDVAARKRAALLPQGRFTPPEVLEANLERMKRDKRPKVICLCGSTRFKTEFREAEKDLGLAGHIVLTVACFGHSGDLPPEQCEKGNEVKDKLDRLHFHKIDMADEVFVINVGGYIGESTKLEINYARSRGKPVRFYEPFPSYRSEDEGLFTKFKVERVDGRDKPGGDKQRAVYFVLDLHHDPAARKAALAYCDEVRKLGYGQLAQDLYETAMREMEKAEQEGRK